MKRIAFVSAIAVVSAVCFSCTKEKESPIEQITEDVSQTPSGHTVTIGLSLSPDTKITHVTEEVDSKINVKTLWAEDDKILVTFTKDAVVKNEVFPLTSGAGETTAYFTKADSELENGVNYEVTYYSSKDYENTFSWAEQDGTVANLPEWLTGSATYPAAPSLTSQLVHFHFVLSNAAAPTEALSLANAYLYTSSDALKVDAANNTGAIKVTPASAFAYNTSGVSSNADFYVSAKLSGTAAGETFNVRLQNGDNYDGIQGYTLSWTASKDYTTDKVWKKASTAENMVYNSGLLGSESNDTSVESATVALYKGQQINYVFKNYSNKVDNWNNWRLCIKDNGDVLKYKVRADSWVEVVNTGCSDNYGTVGTWVDAGAEWYEKRWPAFRNLMDGAEVHVNLNFASTGKLSVGAIAYASTGQKLVETFVASETFSGDVVKVSLEAWWSHEFISSISVDSAYESFSVTPKDGFSKKYYALSDPVYFDKASVNVTATKGNAEVNTIDGDLVTYSTIPATASTSASVTADFAGLAQQNVSNLNVEIGIGQAGGTDCYSLFNWGGGKGITALASGKTATIKLMLYSGMQENYHTSLINLYDSGEVEKFFIRMDNAINDISAATWGGGETNLTSEDLTTFRKDQNHADVTLTIENTGSVVNVRYDITFASGKERYITFNSLNVGTEDVKYNLNTEHSCVVVYSEVIE